MSKKNTFLGEKPYVCSQCTKSFKQISELKEHQKSHSNEKQYVCSECGKCLQSRNGLYVHLKVHRGEKKHECQLCNTKYVTTGELKSHISHIHSTVKPFACPHTDCDKAYVSKGPLHIHMLSHLNTKLYICNFCGKGLATPASLKQHQLVHSDIKPNKCAICSKRFSNCETLRKHMDIHADNKEFDLN